MYWICICFVWFHFYILHLAKLSECLPVHVFARIFQLFFSYLSFHFQFECFIFLFLYCMKIEILVYGDGYIDKNTCSLCLPVHFPNTCIIISVIVCKTVALIFLLWDQDYIFIKDLIHSYNSIPYPLIFIVW